MSRPEHLCSFKQSWRSFAMQISYPDDLAAIKRPDGSTASRGTPRVAFHKLPGRYFDRRGNERFDKASLVELESHDFNLLGSLWTYINDEESDADPFSCYPSMGTLAIECGFGTAAVERSMQRLEATGFVEREQRRNTSSRTIVHRTPGHWGFASKGKVVSIAAEIAPAQAAVLSEDDDAVPNLILYPDLCGVAAQTAVSTTLPLPASSTIATPVPSATNAPGHYDFLARSWVALYEPNKLLGLEANVDAVAWVPM